MAATRRVIPALLVLAAASAPVAAQTQSETVPPSAPAPDVVVAPAASIPYRAAATTVAAPAEAGAVFDAPGLPGIRMMAPIPDSPKPGTSAAVPMPQPKPGGAIAPVAPRAAANVPAAPPPAKRASAKPPAAAAAPSSAAVKSKAAVHANMVQAFAAASKGDWGKARAFATAAANPTFNTLLQWRYLVEAGASAPFEEINSFLAAYPNWPRRDALIAAAEKSMPAFMDPRLVIDWYRDRAPQTATGKIRLGDALRATGDADRGAQLIKSAWIEGSFSPTEESRVLQTYGGVLTADDQRARLDQLLARDAIIDAHRQIPRVDPDSQHLALARLQIKASPALVKVALARLPDTLRGNPELLFDAARAYRRRGLDEEAWATLAQALKDSKPLALPDTRWTERHIMTRDALKAGKYDLAYELVSRHAMQSGGGFADAEFLAGWIALRYLHKPEMAIGHFQALAKGVSLPISRARGYYWLGRAEEELDRPVKAIADYREAALHRETFYGQLALARIDDNPTLVLQTISSSAMHVSEKAFEADERIAAIRLLAELNDRDRMRLFAIRVANDAADASRLQMLAQLMVSLGDPAMGVRVAKLASYNGVVLAANLAPTMPLPRFPGKGAAPEPALVLGLTRQESEFDPKAVSSAGARGLMQLMPASAQKAAQVNHMTYRLSDLTAKPDYNIQLGMAALSDYLAQWGDSYVLAIASYNAGAGNVSRWVNANGDPRDPNVDPIDWIERIPFGETRNYVQRVLENIEIYRHRLGGNGKLTILANLHRPNLPSVVALKDQPAVVPVSVEQATPVLNSPLIGEAVAIP